MTHDPGAMVLACCVALSAIVAHQPDLKVIDGDTIKVDGVSYRLLGYDTPETHFAKCDAERRLGEVARLRLLGLLSDNAWRIEATGKKDRYGRELAHVLVEIEEESYELDVSEILIEDGLARPYDGGRRASWCKPQLKRLSP